MQGSINSVFGDAEADEIAHIAETQGWQVAAHDYMRRVNHRAYRLGIDEYRSQIRFLLPLTCESRVLNLQADWGSVAFNLATHVAFVVAMDHRATRFRFVSARRRQTGVKGVQPLRGAVSAYLPFVDETFDAVIMPDGMEGFKETSSPGSQADERAVFGEVKRVLKKGGWALVGVANRLGIARPSIGFTRSMRSYWGYRRALDKAGFTNLQFYVSLPSHHEPFFIFPAERTQLFDFFFHAILTAHDHRAKLEARGLGLAYRLALGLQRVGRQIHAMALGRYFIPSYLILAQKRH